MSTDKEDFTLTQYELVWDKKTKEYAFIPNDKGDYVLSEDARHLRGLLEDKDNELHAQIIINEHLKSELEQIKALLKRSKLLFCPKCMRELDNNGMRYQRCYNCGHVWALKGGY